jgi:hypoxanthine-DNA glycosylase
MIETHPFGIFAPPGSKYLILGSFAGKEAIKGQSFYDPTYDWYYGTKRNQFWPIIEAVYGVKLENLTHKKGLFEKLGIAIADIIYQCERGAGSNLDSNLKNIVFNEEPIRKILESNKIEKIFFTSRYVERIFTPNFRNVMYQHPLIELVCLPSPSPRFAKMTLDQKTEKYRELLPLLR